MNILFFTYDFPYPTNSGGKTRAYNLLKFAKKDANIVLFSFTRSSFTSSDKHALKEIGVSEIYTFPRRKVVDVRNLAVLFSNSSLFSSLYFSSHILSELLRVVREKQIDLVHFESFYTGYYLHHQLQQLGVKQVFGTENIEYLLYKEYAEHQAFLPKKFFFIDQARKIRKEEEKFYKEADAIITVTQEEKEYVHSQTTKPIEIIANGIDVVLFKKQERKADKEKRLLFIGNFTYFPNVDAMQWFMQNVFPNLSSDVKLLVVGKKSGEMPFLHHSNVETKEYMEDIRDAYKLGTIFVAPIRIGGGTNFKILEAMASGLPVVALQNRVSAFDFTDGKELLIAEDAVEFVEKVNKLLESPAQRAKIAESAYSAVQKKYNWTHIGDKLYDMWKAVLNEKN